MKVKLLKKVRKRFKLQYIEHVDYNEFSTQYSIFEKIGFKPSTLPTITIPNIVALITQKSNLALTGY